MTPTTTTHETERVNASRNAWWKLFTLFLQEAVRDREISSLKGRVVEHAAILADTALAQYESRWTGSTSAT
jgi:hypothetical protein